MRGLVIYLLLASGGECKSLVQKLLGSRSSPARSRSPRTENFALDHLPSPNEVLPTAAGDVTVLGALGAGSYGSVYKAQLDGNEVALKIEKPGASKGCIVGVVPPKYLQIEHEVRVLEAMKGTPGFPSVFAFNFEGRFKYYIMPLFEKNLSAKRKQATDKRIETRALIAIASQMLDRIEAFHKKGLLMYDIHQGNFMFSGDDVFVIDPGMAIPFRDTTGAHIPYGPSPLSAACKQTVYSSRRDMAGRSVSRRDDLERLLFLLVDVNTNSLPWSGKKLSWDQVAKLKGNASLDEICSGKAKWLRPALEYVFSLEFDQEPDYDRIRSVFKQTLSRLDATRLRRAMRDA
jgi:serine/threonine protein kinase